jgi:hypothetical protein
MDRRFLVEAKSFVFLVFEGASVLHVVEKQNFFSCEVLLSKQCLVWLVSTMEELMGILGVFDFVKPFREGSKVTIVRLGRNINGRFVEVVVYGLGGQRGFLRIPEGRGGWGWLKFVGELRKEKDSLVATVGCDFEFSSLAEKAGGKKVLWLVDSVSPVGDFLGKAAGPLSYVEAVRWLHSFPTLRGRTLVPSTEAGPLGKDCCVDVGSNA